MVLNIHLIIIKVDSKILYCIMCLSMSDSIIISKILFLGCSCSYSKVSYFLQPDKKQIHVSAEMPQPSSGLTKTVRKQKFSLGLEISMPVSNPQWLNIPGKMDTPLNGTMQKSWTQVWRQYLKHTIKWNNAEVLDSSMEAVP